jgi:hypothetical protein
MYHSKPYKLITTDNPNATLGEGTMHHYATCLAAANAFAKSTASHKTVVYDDGCVARELNVHEERQLHDVCELLGLEVVED